MRCQRCEISLDGKPKISVEGDTFCYRCAKAEVREREEARRNVARNDLEYAKTEYDRQRTAFDKLHSEWWSKRAKFLGSRRIGCAIAIAGAILGYLAGEEVGEGFGILGVIAVGLIWGKVIADYESRKDQEFRASNPEPTFEKSVPQLAFVPPVRHSPHDHDGTALRRLNYREDILRRDNLICQVCGKKKQRRNLEVHHIVPRSKGGTDDPTNLITLCKHCHDREDWYEHIRMFPTTISKPKRKYRSRAPRW